MVLHRFPYWILPLVSAIIWLAMILTMFLYWYLGGKPRYVSEEVGQHIAYISDVGADTLKPLFIAMGSASVIIFDVGFILERWLRHSGKLVHYTSRLQRFLAGASIFFALLGAVGLILLSIFDTKRHKTLHDLFLAFFIGGYVISAVFILIEYARLGTHNRAFRIIKLSWWMKFIFMVIEVALAIVFGALNRYKKWDYAAIVEWIIALVYTIWVLSFVVDFLPAARVSHHAHPADGDSTLEEQAMAERGYGPHY